MLSGNVIVTQDTAKFQVPQKNSLYPPPHPNFFSGGVGVDFLFSCQLPTPKVCFLTTTTDRDNSGKGSILWGWP